MCVYGVCSQWDVLWWTYVCVSEGATVSVLVPLTSSSGSEFMDVFGLLKMYYFNKERTWK